MPPPPASGPAPQNDLVNEHLRYAASKGVPGGSSACELARDQASRWTMRRGRPSHACMAIPIHPTASQAASRVTVVSVTPNAATDPSQRAARWHRATSPACFAAEKIRRLFKIAQPDPTAPDENGWSAVDFVFGPPACFSSDSAARVEAARLLVAAGGDPQRRDAIGQQVRLHCGLPSSSPWPPFQHRGWPQEEERARLLPVHSLRLAARAVLSVLSRHRSPPISNT